MIRILIVEDEKPISNLIRLSLTKAGYHCTCVYDGNAAVDKLDREIFDLILLDIMLPGANGFELMDYIRPLGIPVIFLTAVNSVNNRVRGLKMGAEDYIIKPFEIVELLARVEVVLRRYNKMIQHLHAAGIDIDTVSMTVKRDDEEIQLTNKEYELLLLFARNPGIALYKETIYERVWGGEYVPGSRTVELHIQRMRKKVGWEKALITIPKVGYRLVDTTFYVVSACLLIFVSFQMSLNKEKANALNAYRMIQNMLLVSNDMNQKAYTYTLSQLASQNDSMWKGIRLKQTGSGTLYYENGYLPYHLNDEDIRTMKTEECCLIRYIQTEDGQYIQVSGLVETGSVPLSLEVSQDVTQVYTARETQLQIYKVILAFVLTAGSVSALLIAEKLTKPIRQLSDVSKKITDGNLSIRADIHSGDEIELLARDFNRMTDTIEDNMHQMADAMKRQEEFMGSFAHELKTPMTSIIGYADLMRSQALDEEEQQEAAEYIFSEGRRLESLSLKLLDLLVLKKKDFELRPTNLQTVIEGAVHTALPSMADKNISLKGRYDDGFCLMESDLVKSLIINLIDNAKKAIDDSGNILVVGRLTEEGCLITVADTGRAMKPEELSRITEAFYRVDKSRSRAQGGAGLGLALCQAIAELHHGQLIFESTPGKGTVVKAVLNGGRTKCE